MALYLVGLLNFAGCQTKHEPLPDAVRAIGCDPATQRCVTISEDELLYYLDALGDKAMLRQQLKACQEGRIP
jgi:hypothetical protein